MKSFDYIITDKIGIHARPAGLMVKEASKYSSRITLKNGDKSGDAKKIFTIMGLGAKKGDRITVEVEGDDEAQATLAMEVFLKNNL
ncbi:MAG: HPr family phosphocarrier protein [Acetivibrionales bacterium]|jgi:phosphocarrier protein HPr